MTFAKFLALFAIVALSLTEAADKKWFETASFYQIYPRSFKDSDGDGIGDLKGVTEKLPYLAEIGITATWLSPIFTSPMADFGYDIANFTEIDPMFGNMADFEALIDQAKAVGVKIILDFVPNHSSDECDWFIRSVNGDPVYKDFYVWHPGKIVNGTRQPPTNWISVFRRSAWTWSHKRQAYYLHQFHKKQPDLNFRNPAVREAMKDVLRFWLRRGVAGFRVDAVPHIFEIAPDANGNWPDEPRNPYVNDSEDYTYLDHEYTTNRPETVHLIYDFRSVLDEIKAELGGDDRILMTEAYAPIDTIMQYYGNGTRLGAQIPFNFELISQLTGNSDAYHYSQLINNYLGHMHSGRTANWVLGNHDTSRIAARFGEDRVDILNTLLFTLPGCSVTYSGEEIGMTDVWMSWNDTMDPQACQSNPNEYERLTRDPERSPFQWNDEKFAGFTTGSSTWLPVASNYRKVNVKFERPIPYSHLNIFKQLRILRNENTFRNGEAEVKALSANVLGIKRFQKGSSTYVVLLNINDHVEVINLHSAFGNIATNVQYELATDKSPKRKGDVVTADTILLMPKEAVVFKSG